MRISPLLPVALVKHDLKNILWHERVLNCIIPGSELGRDNIIRRSVLDEVMIPVRINEQRRDEYFSRPC